jgi:hypothetical protein
LSNDTTSAASRIALLYLSNDFSSFTYCITAEIKIAVAKASFNLKTFHQQNELKCKEETDKCYIWSTALCGAGTWKLRKVDQKWLESL